MMKTTSTSLPLLILLIGVSCFPASPAQAQSKQELRALYDSLRVDTRAFDGIKERWVIVDPIIVREVFTQLKRRASTALAADSILKLIDNAEQLVTATSGSEVQITSRKRYYDDEIELLEFEAEGKRLGSIRDYVLILDALGYETYTLVKTMRYKDRFDATQGKRYDIYLSPLYSSIMLWSTSPTFEWWRISLIGRLGNDHINLPFWFRSSVVAALELLYLDDVTVTDRNYNKFSITAGAEVGNNFSIPNQNEHSANSILKKRILQGSGENFFLRGTWTPEKRLNLLSNNPTERLELTFEGSMAINEKTEYSKDVDTFYSVRNSILLMAQLKNVGLLHFGAGLAWHDVHRITRILRGTAYPGRVEPVRNNFLPFLEFGLSQDGKLLQFDITASINHNIDDGYGFLGVRSKLILSNKVGLDFRYYKAYRPSLLPAWQYQSYILPSVIIRINF
ncbi:MAG: hypothetical protein KF749_12215 [Bacteroidetes bacterium]|nr:hypothetical protein [Bacteroidota bacterium]MCW5895339.1 hypothetical protein [Bacteroidota bacterium]